MGSSFGGAVALELIHRQLWFGPIVLLAPACARYGLDLRLPEGCHAIVIHDPEDEIVPYADSEKLVRLNPNAAELWASDGGHRLSTITGNGMLAQAVETQLSRSSEEP